MRLSTQIEELMSNKYTDHNLPNQKILKDAIENKEKIKQLNKIIKDKDDKITQIQTKVKCQEVENCFLQQQIEELQQKEEDSKTTHKLEITEVYNTLTSNTEEIYLLRSHNKNISYKYQEVKKYQERRQIE